MKTQSNTIFPQTITVGAIQYHMSPIESWENVEQKITSLVMKAKNHNPQILLFPEYFGIHYFDCLPIDWSEKAKLDAVIERYYQYLQLFMSLSKKFQILIIGGSHPVRRGDGTLSNAAHLFSPSGSVYTQEKLHVTPKEKTIWEYSGSDKVCLFDTPFGRIGIQICYDIEFPEVARLMTLKGADIIFVPFFTSDQYGYLRVRYTAQARAVENYLFTVISGSFGNIPENPSLNCFAQSAIFTPSDIGFPMNAIAAEADPKKEMVVFADLDLDYLRKIRIEGTVKPLLDRREDFYTLQLKKEIEIVEVN